MAERGRGGMGDGPVLPSEMFATLDELGIRDQDERRTILDLWIACDSERLQMAREKLDAQKFHRSR